MEIYQTVNQWAKIKGLKQKDIAESLGMLPQQFNRYATGKRKYTAEMIKQIATTYKVSADILLGII